MVEGTDSLEVLGLTSFGKLETVVDDLAEVFLPLDLQKKLLDIFHLYLYKIESREFRDAISPV